MNPTETEIIELMNKIDVGKRGFFSLQELEDLVKQRGKDTDTLDDLIDALKVFDSD